MNTLKTSCESLGAPKFQLKSDCMFFCLFAMTLLQTRFEPLVPMVLLFHLHIYTARKITQKLAAILFPARFRQFKIYLLSIRVSPPVRNFSVLAIFRRKNFSEGKYPIQYMEFNPFSRKRS